MDPRARMDSKTPTITKDLIVQHGLTEEEYQKVESLLGREPNLTELGMFSVMWSEHCSYKSSRAFLKKLPTEGPYVIQGPGENAGVVDIGDGLAAVFKMESHNHPSFIEPYQGAATGVGGILRDIFTMGARPIALLDSLRFGPLDQPKNRYLFSGVVAGIAGYGNCIGVPTVGGEVSFNEVYNHNPLVNGPRREPGMTPYDVLLSESQERMLLVARPGREGDVLDICKKWDVDAAVIGRVTNDKFLRVKEKGMVVAQVPAQALSEDAPK